MGKLTRKIARSLGDRLGRAINYALYDIRYKKVYLEIRSCEGTVPHPEHTWTVQGYIRSNRAFLCEGVNIVYAYAQKDDLEPEDVPRTEDSAR